MSRQTNEMQQFLRMIFIFHYLALHVSDYHQSIISLAVAWMYIHATARLACTNIPMRPTVY